jgi:hypothetical protein
MNAVYPNDLYRRMQSVGMAERYWRSSAPACNRRRERMSQAPNTNAVIGTEIGRSATTSTIKWWQWILYYPQLPVALAGVIGAFFGSLGGLSPVLIRWLDQATQEEQNRLWNNNASCLQGAEVDRVTLRARSLYDVDISACSKTGDVLLQIHLLAMKILRTVYRTGFLQIQFT